MSIRNTNYDNCYDQNDFYQADSSEENTEFDASEIKTPPTVENYSSNSCRDLQESLTSDPGYKAQVPR